MNELSKLSLAAVAAATLLVAGCKDHDDHAGHDHNGSAAHDDHDHAEHAEMGDHEEADAHGDARSLGSVEVAGSTLDISVSGDVTPGNELHLNVKHTSGPIPGTIRLWVGDAEATGALKSKVDSSDGKFHGHVEVPAEVPEGAMLWIEIEDENGDRQTGAVPLT